MRVHVTFPLFENCLTPLRAVVAASDLDVRARPEPWSRAELDSAATDRDAILCTIHDRIDRAFLERHAPPAGRLRFVAQFGVGVDNVDVAAARELGVTVTNTPGVLTDATAEMAVALLLAAARRLGEGERMVRAGAWPGWRPDQLLGRSLAGATLGIVGAGRIGRRTAELLSGFRVEILYWNRTSRPETEAAFERATGARKTGLEDLLRRSDAVSLHVALAPETRGLIGARELSWMKPGAILVNTARGPVVDEAALVEALREGRIGAAGLDVYEREPALAEGLVALENVVLAPHLGSAVIATREAMGRKAVANLIAMLEGREPPDRVA